MNAPLPPRTLITFCSLGLLMTTLFASRELRAESCFHFYAPEVRFQPNSTVPVEGHLDLSCVSRRMDADSALSDIAMILRENPTITMLLVGHADSEEADAEALSLQRAQRMACELISTYGIEPGRLTIEGKGARQPRITERELERMSWSERIRGRQKNRCVEFRVMSFDWIHPHLDEIAAVRFLSDPAPPQASATSFCDEPSASDTLVAVADTSGIVEALDTTSIAVEEPVALSPAMASVQLETLAPMIMPNPIANDELCLVRLPITAEDLSVRMMTLDGRTVLERIITNVAQGARLTLPVPGSLTSGVYILRISSGTGDWSLRFVKP